MGSGAVWRLPAPAAGWGRWPRQRPHERGRGPAPRRLPAERGGRAGVAPAAPRYAPDRGRPAPGPAPRQSPTRAGCGISSAVLLVSAADIYRKNVNRRQTCGAGPRLPGRREQTQCQDSPFAPARFAIYAWGDFLEPDSVGGRPRRPPGTTGGSGGSEAQWSEPYRIPLGRHAAVGVAPARPRPALPRPARRLEPARHRRRCLLPRSPLTAWRSTPARSNWARPSLRLACSPASNLSASWPAARTVWCWATIACSNRSARVAWAWSISPSIA